MDDKERKLALRSMVIAAPGKVLCAFDLSAAEAWVVAYLANEPNMKRELAEGDIHSYAACGIFDLPLPEGFGKERYTFVSEDDRYIGKKMNHSCNYRTGPFKIAEFINKEGRITVSVADAKVFHAKWLSTFNLHNWWAEVDFCAAGNRVLTTTYGFRRKFWGIYNDDLKKQMTAFEPQSTVADHMNGVVHPELGIRGGSVGVYEDIVKPSNGEIRMCNTAHDSMMLEVPFGLVESVVPQVISLLRRPLVVKGEQFTIPVDAEVGERWKEMEKWTS